MNTSDFDYHLPPELIAQCPAARRDASRMMVLHRDDGRIEHRVFSDLPDYLQAGDLLILNNTRVIPARIFGKKSGSGGKVEFLMLEEVQAGVWDVLMRCRRRPGVGGEIILGDGHARAVLLEDGEMGRARVRIDSPVPVLDLLEKYGEPPLPPYIQRSAISDQKSEDRERYQTVYAKQPGAVAAPTAGLHFTPEVFERLRAKGVDRAEVTLHVGLGTFRPVTTARIEEHRMEAERYEIREETARNVAETKSRSGRVVAVGSTAVRTLEACSPFFSAAEKKEGRTALFIRPPYEFKVVDAMLTNFHLPKSTLIMMVSALAGRELIFRAYEEAIREKYRFFSYGDCMLIL
ncbi:MAG: tRNA preQ1(34) S-adenosylmethionine ribosyltransferase-isomerase QueA [bacterium]